MAFLPPFIFNFLPQVQEFQQNFTFNNTKDNTFDKQLITTFALNDLKNTEIVKNMYFNDILNLADTLNKTPTNQWKTEIKNTLMNVNSEYWKIFF